MSEGWLSGGGIAWRSAAGEAVGADSPPAGEVHVWHARLGAPGSGGGDDGGRADAALLSADERARVEAFAFAEPRRRWVWARATLRRVLARYLGAGEPAAIAFAYGEHGKPSLAGGGLSFNLSHTGERLVVAIAREGALGVDVERVSRCTSPLVLADRYFAAAEAARLRAVPAPGRAGAFAALWTAKEAYAKALGRGLPLPLRDFEVIGELAAPAIGRTAAEDPRAPGDWVLAQAAVAPDCLCTVAWAAGPGAVALVEWGRLVEGPGDGSGAGAEVGAPAAK